MSERINGLVEKIRELERLIESEIEAGRPKDAAEHGYRLAHGEVTFEAAAVKRHRDHRRSLAEYLLESPVTMLLGAPLLYAMLVPIALLDLASSVFQSACFRLYGIPRVRRADYVVLDRRKLGYLNWFEKLNCDYCSYANGVAAYAREIGARTEQFFCPIKHARRILGTHHRYCRFLEYGDAEAWRRELPVLRETLRAEG